MNEYLDLGTYRAREAGRRNRWRDSTGNIQTLDRVTRSLLNVSRLFNDFERYTMISNTESCITKSGGCL